MKPPSINTSQHDHGAIPISRAVHYKQFIKDALDADQTIDAGEQYSAGVVHTWLEHLARDGKAERPKLDRK